MKNCIVLFLLLCTLPNKQASAQGENNIWCFGRKLGLNFNGPNPVLFSSKVNVLEASASVCDAGGNLLFYIGSDTVWDRNHNILQNGTGISGNGNSGSSGRGVAIAQSISDEQRYFLFTTDAIEQASYNVYYSVVDRSLNGGLGGIVPTMKNILLDTGIVEPLNIIPKANCTGYWLLLHRRSGKHYLAYSIDAAGIATTPVISTGVLSGNPAAGNSGYMQTNNSGTRSMLSLLGGTEFAVFNNSTGIFSNFQALDTLLPNYFTCSPDDSKLYIAANSGLYQGDFSLFPNMQAFKNSIVQLDSAFYSGARLGPDNKIYVLRNTLSIGIKKIARISAPNSSGMACNLDTAYLSLPFSWPFAELGTPVPQLALHDTLYSSMDTLVCTALPLVLQGDAQYYSFLWSTGSTQPQESFSASGTYWLKGRQGCAVHIDSFHISFHDAPEVDLGPDTSICRGDTLMLRLQVPGASYLWQDGSRDSVFKVAQKGWYTVQVSQEPCRYFDSVLIDVIVPFLDIPQPDTTLCSDVRLTLSAEVQPASSLSWNTGNSGNQIEIDQQGVYRVTAINQCGTFTDSVTITMETCNCNAFVPNAFSPNNDGINEVLEVKLNCPGIQEYVFAIYNRYGQRVFLCNAPSVTWDGTIGQQQADIGTYFYYLRYKDARGNAIRRKGDITLLR